jgi:hypothetical protein
MQSNRRREYRGVLRAGPEDRLLTAIRHHQALRDRDLWRQEINGIEKKPRAIGRVLPRDDPNGFAAGIARMEFGRFYFRETAATKGKPGKGRS